MCLIGYPDICHFRAYSDKKFFDKETSKIKNEFELAQDYQKDSDLADSILSKLMSERLNKFSSK
jgi:hypothetical protein